MKSKQTLNLSIQYGPYKGTKQPVQIKQSRGNFAIHRNPNPPHSQPFHDVWRITYIPLEKYVVTCRTLRAARYGLHQLYDLDFEELLKPENSTRLRTELITIENGLHIEDRRIARERKEQQCLDGRR